MTYTMFRLLHVMFHNLYHNCWINLVWLLWDARIPHSKHGVKLCRCCCMSIREKDALVMEKQGKIMEFDSGEALGTLIIALHIWLVRARSGVAPPLLEY